MNISPLNFFGEWLRTLLDRELLGKSNPRLGKPDNELVGMSWGIEMMGCGKMRYWVGENRDG